MHTNGIFPLGLVCRKPSVSTSGLFFGAFVKREPPNHKKINIKHQRLGSELFSVSPPLHFIIFNACLFKSSIFVPTVVSHVSNRVSPYVFQASFLQFQRVVNRHFMIQDGAPQSETVLKTMSYIIMLYLPKTHQLEVISCFIYPQQPPPKKNNYS